MSEMSSETKPAESALPSLTKLGNTGTALGIVGLVLLVAGFFSDKTNGAKLASCAYLYGYIFWMGVTLGCTTLTFLHHTVRAKWSLSILRVAEAGNKNLWIMALFFLPILLLTVSGNTLFYPWVDPAIFNKLHANKQGWFGHNGLNWAIRTVVYFVFWIWSTSRLNKSSLEQDKSLDENLAEARKSFAPPMGVLHVIFLTFAMTDWLMSLSPYWISTLYGAWHMITELLTAVALGTMLVMSLRDKRPFADAVNPALSKDLGNMMLGFTMFFGYFTLSQFLIIWSGNLPEETVFFVQRFDRWMVVLGGVIVVCQFFGPFLALLAGKTKRTYHLLRIVAFWIFTFRIVDIWWQVAPFFKTASQFATIWIDLGALLFVGGIWLARFAFSLKQHDLMPLHDTRNQETKRELEAHGHA